MPTIPLPGLGDIAFEGPAHAQHAEWDHPNGFHMRGDAYLTQQGQLRADITTWTTSWGLGFTGGATVLVVDQGGNLMHRWLIWPLGVDARWVWWKRSQRTDTEWDQIDPSAVPQAGGLELLLGHLPKDRWDDIINETSAKADDLINLWKRYSSM